MKRNISVYGFLFAFSFFGLLYGVDDSGSSGVTQKPRTVPQVDLNRYVGTWYEIAKIPNRFKKNAPGIPLPNIK